MSRLGAGGPILVKPVNNIYTALAVVAVVAEIVGLVVLILKFQAFFGKSIFGG